MINVIFTNGQLPPLRTMEKLKLLQINAKFV